MSAQAVPAGYSEAREIVRSVACILWCAPMLGSFFLLADVLA